MRNASFNLDEITTRACSVSVSRRREMRVTRGQARVTLLRVLTSRRGAVLPKMRVFIPPLSSPGWLVVFARSVYIRCPGDFNCMLGVFHSLQVI